MTGERTEWISTDGKTGDSCSVENLYSDNHYVMRYGPQDDLAGRLSLPRPHSPQPVAA